MQEDGGAEGASGLGAQPRCTSAPKATVGLAGCSSLPRAATESAASAEVVGGGEACLSPLGLSEGRGGAGAQHWLVNEGGGGEEADESLPAGEEGGGGEGPPHLFSLDGGEEEMEYCGAPEGGEAGRPRSLLSSSSDEESELRVRSGDEQEMEASDSAESFVTARRRNPPGSIVGSFQGKERGGRRKRNGSNGGGDSQFFLGAHGHYHLFP